MKSKVLKKYILEALSEVAKKQEIKIPSYINKNLDDRKRKDLYNSIVREIIELVSNATRGIQDKTIHKKLKEKFLEEFNSGNINLLKFNTKSIRVIRNKNKKEIEENRIEKYPHQQELQYLDNKDLEKPASQKKPINYYISILVSKEEKEELYNKITDLFFELSDSFSEEREAVYTQIKDILTGRR
jgi:hypothetical protein